MRQRLQRLPARLPAGPSRARRAIPWRSIWVVASFAPLRGSLPASAIAQTGDHRMAVRHREDLVLGTPATNRSASRRPRQKTSQTLRRSLRLRQVSAAAATLARRHQRARNIGWDLGRFGIQFVASPRHADGLLITGPVSCNMELALRKTYEAVPAPRSSSPPARAQLREGRSRPSGSEHGRPLLCLLISTFPVPPHPLTILDGLLRLLNLLDDKSNMTPVSGGFNRQRRGLQLVNSLRAGGYQGGS